MTVLTSLRMSAKLENLGTFIGSLSNCAKTQGFEQEKVSRMELAAEEALVMYSVMRIQKRRVTSK